jgi:hypothetical protein
MYYQSGGRRNCTSLPASYDKSAAIERGPNTGSGRYSLGTDTKPVDNVRTWYQAGLVTA